MPDFMHKMLAVATLIGAVACGNDTDGQRWTVDDPGVDMAEEGECEEDADCGEGSYCHEPAYCEEPKYCAEGVPPYSAAAPVVACLCDGSVGYVGAGYPGRHAWQAGGATYTESEGEPCDTDAEFPRLYSLVYTLPDDRPDRLLASLGASGNESTPVPESGVLTLEALADGWPDFTIRFLEDVDGDGACSEGEAVYLGTAEERRIDYIEFVLYETLVFNEVDCDFW